MRFKYHYLVNFLLFILYFTGCSIRDTNSDESAVNDQLNLPTQVVVQILDLDSILATLSTPTLPIIAPSPSFTRQVIPSTTASLTPSMTTATATLTPKSPSCTNLAELVKNLNINNYTVMNGGQMFAKIWRIKNTGTCTWTTDYSLVYAGGETMGGKLSNPLQNEVKPGETIDLRLDLIAPFNAQSFSGNWMLQDPFGNLFGMGENNNESLSVVIVVKPTPRVFT